MSKLCLVLSLFCMFIAQMGYVINIMSIVMMLIIINMTSIHIFSNNTESIPNLIVVGLWTMECFVEQNRILIVNISSLEVLCKLKIGRFPKNEKMIDTEISRKSFLKLYILFFVRLKCTSFLQINENWKYKSRNYLKFL